MNTARIAVLAVALVAGGIAAYLASGASEAPAPAQPVAQIQTVDILVAKTDIGLGQSVKPDDLQWQAWPAATASSSLINRSARADAFKEFTGSIARSPFVAGEPIREQKLVKADGSGFMAAILPSGMRAISVGVTAESAASGFILPGDHVDIILTRRDRAAEKASGTEVHTSETILGDVRVLAIDQAPKEKEGSSAMVGKTATLELKPEQAETLARARQGGTLTLALRSIVDANAVEKVEEQISRNEGLNVVRYGVALQQSTQK
jgi:pilus assembly protein CpaB